MACRLPLSLTRRLHRPVWLAVYQPHLQPSQRMLSTGSDDPPTPTMRLPPKLPAADAASPSFKVTKVSYTGSIQTVNLRVDELLKSASIYARDLFTLNLTSRQERRRAERVRRTVSEIQPRDSLLLLSYGNIRAVAGLEEVYLFDAHSPVVQEFAGELALVYRSGRLEEPPELVFLERVLEDTVDSFNRRLRIYEPIVDSFLDRVANEVYSDTGVHQLVPLKDSLQSFEIQVKQSLDCLTELLQDDDEMLSLLLREQAEARATGVPVDFSRHEHVELLLGVYARQMNNIHAEVNYLLMRIQSKQEFVALALAGYRNRMVRMNVHIGIAGLSFGLGTTMAGFFGMNLINGFESSPHAFTTVIGLSGLGSLLIAATSLNYLSGKTMRVRASRRLDEIETLTNALSDMCALDYTIKSVLDGGRSLDKEEFRAVFRKARQTKKVSRGEVDLLFDVFDRVKDGQIQRNDFESSDSMRSKHYK